MTWYDCIDSTAAADDIFFVIFYSLITWFIAASPSFPPPSLLPPPIAATTASWATAAVQSWTSSVTRPITMMCQLMPPVYDNYPFTSGKTQTLLCVSVSLRTCCWSSRNQEIRIIICNNKCNITIIIIMGCALCSCCVAEIMVRLFTVIVKFGGFNLMDFVARPSTVHRATPYRRCNFVFFEN